MAALSNVHAASILNTSLRSGTYYLALFLTDPTASGTGTEASGGGYARKVIAFDAPTLVAGKQQVKNADAVDYGVISADICTVRRSTVKTRSAQMRMDREGGNLYSLTKIYVVQN